MHIISTYSDISIEEFDSGEIDLDIVVSPGDFLSASGVSTWDGRQGERPEKASGMYPKNDPISPEIFIFFLFLVNGLVYLVHIHQ